MVLGFFCDWDMWGWTIPDGMIVCDKPHFRDKKGCGQAVREI